MGGDCSAAYPFDRETATDEPGISGLAVALDRRTHLRLAQPLAPIEQGLRGLARNHRSADSNRHDPIDDSGGSQPKSDLSRQALNHAVMSSRMAQNRSARKSVERIPPLASVFRRFRGGLLIVRGNARPRTCLPIRTNLPASTSWNI